MLVAVGVFASWVADGVTEVGVAVTTLVADGDGVMVGVGVGSCARQRAKCTSDPRSTFVSTHTAYT